MDPQKSRELATALGAASEQIGLALFESHSAVETLGSSLERLSEMLSSSTVSPGPPITGSGTLGSAGELAALHAELARAITGLQFYDRMAQHLTHVREYLNGTVEQLQSTTGTFETLNRRLADRLLSDTHRIHLGKNLATEFLTRPGPLSKGQSKKGDIDLF